MKRASEKRRAVRICHDPENPWDTLADKTVQDEILLDLSRLAGKDRSWDPTLENWVNALDQFRDMLLNADKYLAPPKPRKP